VVCGGSNASRLADALEVAGKQVINLTTSGWRTTPGSIEVLAMSLNEISEENKDKRIVVVYQILDNSCYYVKTEDGSLHPVTKSGMTGGYHVAGSLMVAPRELVAPIINTATAALTAGEVDARFFLCPLPRYLFSGCCGSFEHCTNMSEEDYGQQMLTGLGKIYSTAKELLRNGKTRDEKIVTLNPTWVMAGGERLTNSKLMDALFEVWGEDPVHMGNEAYFKLAAGVLNAAQKSARTTSTGKRPREESGSREEGSSGHRTDRGARRGAHRAGEGGGRGYPRGGGWRSRSEGYPRRGMRRGSWRGPRRGQRARSYY
jgi:hypothetical protein